MPDIDPTAASPSVPDPTETVRYGDSAQYEVEPHAVTPRGGRATSCICDIGEDHSSPSVSVPTPTPTEPTARVWRHSEKPARVAVQYPGNDFAYVPFIDVDGNMGYDIADLTSPNWVELLADEIERTP